MSKPHRLRIMRQTSRQGSSWSARHRIGIALWSAVWLALFRPTPKQFYRWRVLLLRIFGCTVSGIPYVDSSAKVKMPWNLQLGDGACLGPHSEVYNLGLVIVRSRATVAQHVYLCGGTHDMSLPELPLVVGDITIGEEAFIGAKAIVLPGVEIGDGAVIGAGSVVTRDMPPWMVSAGNPCRPIKPRVFAGRADADALSSANVESPAPDIASGPPDDR